MAKKFGKLLLLGAAIGSVAGAVYYFKKREAEQNDIDDDDYDDFDDDEDDDSRSYVSLNPDAAVEKATDSEGTESSGTNASGETPDDNIPTGQSMFQEYASASADEFFEENTQEKSSEDEDSKDNSFTPLTGQVADAADKNGESVEEFFDEEDAPGVEPPINDN